MSRLCFIPSGCLNSPRVVIGLHHDSARSAHPGLDSCHCAPRSRQRSMAALFRGSRNVLLRWNKHVDLAHVSMRSMASKTPVGFIGLGNMGSPMAKNLLKNGYPVIATDVFPESCKELQDLGAQVLDSPADVAEKADRIITMLPSSPNVIEVYTGPNGILKKVKKGTLLIDSSTIDPSVSKEMAVAAEKMGAVFMDAPVSGGVGAASLAKLTFMVGGVEEEYNAAQELLTCMGANVVYCGQVGTGQAAKICNNMLLAIGMIGTAETMNLGIRLGLDPKLLAKILNMSSGRCWSSDTYNPVPGVMDGVPSANNYQGGFGTTLMAKVQDLLPSVFLSRFFFSIIIDSARAPNVFLNISGGAVCERRNVAQGFVWSITAGK
uniref:3-hydroxyisobutyrate dehydrogenase n=1 Tax=Scophthalmus maximus TaxID=52904 RepID=A0A8D3ECP3_SCOMX